MTTRRTLFRALAALATLPLFGKAAAVEAAPDPKALFADEKTIAAFDALVAGDEAQAECLAQGGDFERFNETEWQCTTYTTSTVDIVRAPVWDFHIYGPEWTGAPLFAGWAYATSKSDAFKVRYDLTCRHTPNASEMTEEELMASFIREAGKTGTVGAINFY